MKHRRSPLLIILINLYNAFLAIYIIIRAKFAEPFWWLGLLNTFAIWLFMPLLLLIPLALFLRGKRTAALSFILVLIGFLKFAPIPQRSKSKHAHDLRVLAFNVWYENEAICKTVDWILEQDADVLILEEFIRAHQSELPRLSEVYPYQVSISGGTKIFSRLPFVDSQILQLENADDDHHVFVAHAVIDVQGESVSIYGAHFNVPRQDEFHFGIETEAWPLSFFLRYDERRRNRRIRALVEKLIQDPNPIILAGDFNTSHSSRILETFKGIGLVDSFTKVGWNWGMTWPYTNKFRPMLRIDYIWASPSLHPLRFECGDYQGSDHLPIMADFVVLHDL